MIAGCASSPRAKALRALDEGDAEGAALHFREAAEADPDDASAWLELGRAEMSAERPRLARAAFERSLAITPRAATPRILLGMTYELERRYDEALLAYRHACALAPSSEVAHRYLGSRLLRWGEAREAIAPLRAAIAIRPRPASYFGLVVALQRTGDRAGAFAVVREGLRRFPRDPALELALAALYVDARELDRALAIYDARLVREPGFAALHGGRAVLLFELGRVDEAEAALLRAIALAPNEPRYRAQLARIRER